MNRLFVGTESRHVGRGGQARILTLIAGVWILEPDAKVRQFTEVSFDQGQSWSRSFEALYERR